MRAQAFADVPRLLLKIESPTSAHTRARLPVLKLALPVSWCRRCGLTLHAFGKPFARDFLDSAVATYF